ncbi:MULTISPECIES: Fe-S cluster assembly protein SufD [unclassified Oceanobacter]|uniref:Fe-S cluster assembly protein SufD n=2 Tax=Gammaproteobacteria TaxID=1236 RepID=UPI0027333965|nr:MULTISPECIES: Fe-S cluster assembly protein SufD [unclassified Oceanobacter]MDP2504907.1 Fe-S cluster assembly protein SufD [Oceanobacter sp. 3_MG-2023]MDP2546351.1 Fe-S cluster assembly protein SufD [Oceanobacter sp. 4_MG-2023]
MATVFQDQQLQRVNGTHAPDWLQPIRAQGSAAFAAAPWPTRKTEAWKYCSLKTLAGDSYHADIPPITAANNKDLAAAATIAGLDSYQLVLVNGQIHPELSSALALEQVVLFENANTDQQAAIAEQLANARQQSNHHLFNDLNDAVLNSGVLVTIGRNSQLDKPLQICSINTGAESAYSVNSRVLVVLETNAELTLIEQFASVSAHDDNSFTNNQTDIQIGDNARLTHYRLNRMQSASAFIGSSRIDLQRDAHYQAFHLGLGSALTRNDLVVNHNIGGSHSEISGVYVPQGSQLVDFHTCIEHAAAHCTSNEVFRGIINDQAKAVFNGRIHIHKDAQKTLAELSNKNLLLTNKAEIDTKPELEIYADDVKCAHGATVAQLDDKARFYLQSRGISEQDAQVMLSFGFINELLDALPHPAIGDWLRPLLAQRFGRAPAFTTEQVEALS